MTDSYISIIWTKGNHRVGSEGDKADHVNVVRIYTLNIDQ